MFRLIAKKLDIDVKQQTQQSGAKRKKSELKLEASVGLCEITEWIKPEDKIRTFAPIHQQPVSEVGMSRLENFAWSGVCDSRLRV